MQKIHIYTLLLALITLQACNFNKSSNENEQLPEGTKKGVVKEVIQAQSYTYLKLDQAEGMTWIAAPTVEVKEGTTIYYDGGLEMRNFESKTLSRLFEVIYFVDGIRYEAAKPVAEAIQEHMNKQSGVPVSNISVEQPAGALSLAKIFETKSTIENQRITVRGQIVKVNNGILGTNWVHIQDGSSYNGDYDLTVTTDGEFEVGQVVTFNGLIALNKDFGAGYSYTIIMEEAVAVVSQ